MVLLDSWRDLIRYAVCPIGCRTATMSLASTTHNMCFHNVLQIPFWHRCLCRRGNYSQVPVQAKPPLTITGPAVEHSVPVTTVCFKARFEVHILLFSHQVSCLV